MKYLTPRMIPVSSRWIGTLWFLVLAMSAGCLAAPPPLQQPEKVPDVVILVWSGMGPTDQIIVTYNSAVSEQAALADIEYFTRLTGLKPQSVERPETKGSPKTTVVVFNVNGTINWNTGAVYVEPFIVTFKRFNLIKVNYVTQGTFLFHGLRNWSDKYVDIKWADLSTGQMYDITVKDRNFEKLGLPLIVDPDKPTKPKPKEQPSGRGKLIWIGLIVALVAGAVVFVIASRSSRTRM